MKFLEKRGFSPDRAENSPTRVKIPPNRRNQYDHFLAAYAELRELVDKIEYAHLSFHNAAGDSSKRSRLSIETYELQALLSEKAQFSKIFAFV